MKKFTLINTQIALFFKGKIERPDLLYNDLNIQLGQIFTLPPTILPLPNDQQFNEIPVVQLRSLDNVFNLNLARLRVDLFVAGEGDQLFEDKRIIFIEKAKILLDFFRQQSEIKRIGFVSRFFVEDESQETIKSVFVNDFINLHTVNGSELETIDAYARYSSKNKYKNLEINNYSSIEKQQATISKVGIKKGVVITRDFNTSPEKDYSSQINSLVIEDFINENSLKFNLDGFSKLLWQI